MNSNGERYPGCRTEAAQPASLRGAVASLTSGMTDSGQKKRASPEAGPSSQIC